MSSGRYGSREQCLAMCRSNAACMWVGYRTGDRYCEFWGSGSCQNPHYQPGHDIYNTQSAPTPAHTAAPTPPPTAAPTNAPTPTPTAAPTEVPSLSPTSYVTVTPTATPTPGPTPVQSASQCMEWVLMTTQAGRPGARSSSRTARRVRVATHSSPASTRTSR